MLSELHAVAGLGHDVWILPMHPRGAVLHAAASSAMKRALIQPLLSIEIMAAALRCLIRAPLQSLRAVGLALSLVPRHCVTNLAAYPKALWIAEQARKLGVEHIHAHWATTTATMAMVASYVSGIPWSFTAHRYDILDNNLFARKVRRAVFARAISESGVGMATQRCGVEPGALVVLHMGVPVATTVAPDAGAHRPFRLLCPARLSPVKGHEYLLQALTLLKDPIELWLVGDGGSRDTVRAQINELGLTSVRIMGQVPQEQLLGFYRDHEVDAVVLPSVDLGDGLHEGIPVALMEAMAYAIPVISTTTGGIPELLRGGAGLLVRDKDPSALAAAIEVLQRDRALREKLGRAARERIVTEFSSEAVARELVRRMGAKI